MKRIFFLTLPFALVLIVLIVFLIHSSKEVYLEKYSNGHIDISIDYPIGNYHIVGPICFGIVREHGTIVFHVPTFKNKYSYKEIYVKESFINDLQRPIKLINGTVELFLANNKINIDLTELKDEKEVPLNINGEYKFIKEEMNAFPAMKYIDDIEKEKCVFNKTLDTSSLK